MSSPKKLKCPKFSMSLKTRLVFLALAATSVAQQCPIQFDGRVPQGSTPATFDTSASNFDTKNVLGAGLTWSDVIQLPTVPTSLFDQNDSTAVGITISDASIFNAQTGFRRAELLPISNNGSDPSTIGIKTLHFSLMLDSARPLNFSHEYQLVFVETADFSTNQFALKTGKLLGGSAVDGQVLTLQSNVRDPTTLLETKFTEDVWHNFALTLNFDDNTIQVFYSEGVSALEAVTDPIENDNSGRGHFHFGLLKKPTGEGLTDITKQGFQEPGIDEGIIYGGIFEEDSADGCITLE